MIRTFEEYTHELTEEEREFIMPHLIKTLTSAVGVDRAVTNSTIVGSINYILKDEGIKTSGPRIRHMIHILRVTNVIPLLIATSKGYYVTHNMEAIETYIGSLEDRLRSISAVLRALKQQRDYYKDKPEQQTLIM